MSAPGRGNRMSRQPPLTATVAMDFHYLWGIRPMGGSNSANEGISRRRVVQGIAWTAPVVLAVSATPAFAASPCQELIVSSSCVRSVFFGNQYPFTFQPCPGSTIKITNVTGNGWVTQPSVAQPGLPYTVSAANPLRIDMGISLTATSFTFFYSIDNGPTQTLTVSIPTNACPSVFGRAAVSEDAHVVFGEPSSEKQETSDEESPAAKKAESAPAAEEAEGGAPPESTSSGLTDSLPEADSDSEPMFTLPGAEPVA